MADLDDTIVALASAKGGAARGILRLTGPDAWTVVRRLSSDSWPDLGHGRRFKAQAFPCAIALRGLHTPLPATLYLWRAPRSYTGQDLIEIHTLGAPPLLELALAELIAVGARQATPGEFTLRAFLHGKLDLTEAEAILGLVCAANSRQAEVALKQMAGGIARPTQALRDRMLDLLAELEAGLDFAEEDLEFIDRDELNRALADASTQLKNLQRQMQGRSVSNELPRVLLLGPPNAGKSSLFNALLGHDAAIVSQVAGTTRDYLIGRLELSDSTVELVDSAGIDAAAHDPIGHKAQRARDEVAQGATLYLWCNDASGDASRHSLPPDLQAQAGNALFVETKADLINPEHGHAQRQDSPPATVRVSSWTGAGLDELRHSIGLRLRELDDGAADVVAHTAVRCRDAIERAAIRIETARAHAQAKIYDELTAAELRAAIDELGSVVGVIYTDDLLDRVFSRFCIGK